MSLTRKVEEDLLDRGYSRRQVARIALGGAAALPFFHEFALAQDAAPPAAGGRGGRGARGGSGGFGGGGRGASRDPDAVVINQNENPMGPTKEGLEAITRVSALAWRYTPAGDNNDLLPLLQSTEDVKQGYVTAYPGSGPALAALMPAFTSPTRGWIMGKPGYGQGGGRAVGNKIIQVPLREDYTHDVEAMVKADPNAGAFYICNPNNPTGTLTPRKDFEYILANKPKDSVLIIDEAYIHFSGRDSMSTDLVKADKDVIVLRTFSKIYGMAGLRAGAAFGKPDLLAKLAGIDRGGNLSQGTMACAAASLKANATVMPERIGINKRNRELALEHLQKLGIAYTPAVSNFFMMSVKGMTGTQVGAAMQAKKIYLANRWANVWPGYIRVTVGTYEEMTKFNAALSQVVQEGPPRAAGQAG